MPIDVNGKDTQEIFVVSVTLSNSKTDGADVIKCQRGSAIHNLKVIAPSLYY
jgi:hypothetical protein